MEWSSSTGGEGGNALDAELRIKVMGEYRKVGPDLGCGVVGEKRVEIGGDDVSNENAQRKHTV